MADQSDVITQLAAMSAAALYPAGTSQPSPSGYPVKVYPGWPVPNVLDADLLAGKVHLSIYPLATERNTTRHISEGWRQIQAPAHTITAAVANNTVAISGTASAQNVLIQVDGLDYIYTVQPSDTINGIAAALSALIPNSTSSGPVVTITGAHAIIARVGGFGQVAREIRRQEKQFQLSVWAPTPSARDAVAKFVDTAFADVYNLAFSDGSIGFMRYSHSNQTDQTQKAGLYRRDIVYTVDFATTRVQQATEVVAPVLGVVSELSGQTILTKNL
ncbi:hypothetical protein [Chromobacterium rhizoryzae]|uniref:Uncharacterized protein n=1 Tax=Chromobacterium rhizoryzae TaxID=1778675 RepID=A0AAD0RRG7_9NEIS|nr:hypothetical protein [Chromobacterium rhizoryzae]AXT46354.1 hypothetical protein D1345_09205 [Chromobacterium rhizoryzae]